MKIKIIFRKTGFGFHGNGGHIGFVLNIFQRFVLMDPRLRLTKRD